MIDMSFIDTYSKDELIIKAIHEAQKRNEVSDRAALALIEEAQSDINDVVSRT